MTNSLLENVETVACRGDRSVERALLLAAAVSMVFILGPSGGDAVAQVAESTESPYLESPANPWSGPLVLQGRALVGVRPQVVGEILTGAEGGELAIATLAVPAPGSSTETAVSLFVEIDGASFLDSNQTELTRLEVYAYALGANDNIVDFVAEAFAVDVSRYGERIWQSGLEFFGRLELPPGSYTLRVLVRNFQSGAKGRDILSFEVPDFAGGGSTALTPLFPEPKARDGWMPVCSWDPAVRQNAEPYPFVVSSGPVNPAARPVLVAGRRAVVYLPVSKPPPGTLEGAVELLKPGVSRYQVVAEGKADVTRAPVSEGDFEILTLRFTAPQAPPGAHWVRVTVRASGGRAIQSPPMKLVLVGGETRDRDLIWSDLRGLLAPSPPVVQAVAEEPRRIVRTEGAEARRLQNALAREYREVLMSLGSEPTESARGRLFEFESGALGGLTGGGVPRLHAAELSVAAELGRSHLETVTALARLHDQIYERYRARRLFSLLFHTRSLLEELAELHVDLGGPPETAARILTSLAGYLQEANLAATSRRLFERALEYDPKNAVALLGLAASHEKYGEYSQAISQLEQLVEIEPDLEEGLLRLAINLDRMGMSLRARELFQRIIDTSEPGWVSAIAYQELARGYLETGAIERAAALLRSAVEEIPDRQGLRVLLAHSEARLGRTMASLERLREFGPSPRSERSERLLYDTWPANLLAESRRALAEAAEKAEAAVSEALAQTTREGW
jgi:tetratricopeptide (TPR) repeat protein